MSRGSTWAILNFKISNFQIFSNFKIFSGSQLLSDFQTFFLSNTSSTSLKLEDLVKKMSTWQKLGTSVAVTVSVFVTCLCWSLGHVEQLLFSCVSSKVSICNYVTCHLSHFTFHMSHVICEMLMLILWICWTTFVFLSMLKSHSHTLFPSFTLSFSHSRHAEWVLFSCLCSKFTDYRWKWQCVFLPPHPPPHRATDIELVPS